MTEVEWLVCNRPRTLLRFLFGKVSDRKVRLFGCACCRAVWPRLVDERSRKAVELTERFADDLVGADDMYRALADACVASEELESSLEDSEYDREGEDRWEAAEMAWKVTAAAWGYIYDVAAGGGDEEQAVALIRDVFGNPFRPVSIDPAWLRFNNGVVVTLARAFYDERDPSRLPVLADALEDAGCVDQNILTHCRSGGPHVRGCWVVDLLLGKR
jgi:hypothetical protein